MFLTQAFDLPFFKVLLVKVTLRKKNNNKESGMSEMRFLLCSAHRLVRRSSLNGLLCLSITFKLY